MFDLIKSVIDSNAQACKNDINYTQTDLEGLYNLTSKHGIAHIIAEGLQRNGKLGSNEISQKFKNSKNLACYSYILIDDTLKKLCMIFDEICIPYLPLKGSVIRKLYPEPYLRTSCDIDILIKEEDLTKAIDVLVQKHGYKNGKKNEYDYSLFSPNNIHIELHFSLTEGNGKVDKVLSTVWDNVYLKNDSGYHYYMTNEFFVFYHIAHIAKHFLYAGCGIKPFIDLWIINNRMDYDESLALKLFKSCGLDLFYNECVYLSKVWFDGEQHTPMSSKLSKFVIGSFAYGNINNSIVINQIKDGKTKHLSNTIFLSYDSLKALYPILNKCPILFPFVQVFRWLQKLFGHRRTYSFKLLNNIAKTSHKEIEYIADLMKKLGLS